VAVDDNPTFARSIQIEEALANCRIDLNHDPVSQALKLFHRVIWILSRTVAEVY